MPQKRTFRESFHQLPPWGQNSLKNTDLVIPILDEDNIEYHPEDSLSLLGIDKNEVRDVSIFQGNANPTDGYPFSPVIETMFGFGFLPERKNIDVVSEQSTKAPVSISCTNSFDTMTQSSVNEVNLDDVPMDIVTSDAENEERVEASPSNYTTLISEVLKSSLFNVHRTDNSTDLDEMELRSRALRSLLLKRRSPTKDNEQSASIGPNAKGTNISVSTDTLATKTLSIGSGKHFSQCGAQNRFVITIADNSDSDSSDDTPFSNPSVLEPDNRGTILGIGLSGASSTVGTASAIATVTAIASTVVTVTPTTYSNAIAVANDATTATNTTPALITKLSNQSNAKKSRASEQAQRRLLHRKMELLRMTLTVKRQQRIVDERRQLMNNLFKTLTELRMRVRTTRKLYNKSYESLQEAAGAQHCYRRKLLSAQREYAQACSAIKVKDTNAPLDEVRQVPNKPAKKTLTEPVKKTVIEPAKKEPGEPVKSSLMSAAPSEPVALLRSRLMTRFMQILENVKVTTPYFNYYRFDLPLVSDIASRNSSIPPTSKIETTSVIEESKRPSSCSTVLNSAIRVDPNVPLCPFSLDGECKDAGCLLQHPSTAPKKAPVVTVSAPIEIKTVNSIPQTKPSVAEDRSSCPVCTKPLLTNTVDNNQPMLRRWHALYLTYKCSVERGVSADFSKVCSTSLDLIRQSENSPELIDHHLELLYSQPTGTMTRDIVQCLKVSDYSISACKSIFRTPLLSGMVRRLLARSALEDLVPRLNKPPHTEDPTSALSTSFVYLAYHLSWLLAEAGNMQSACTHLDKLLTNIRKKHPVRYGLWWLKLSMILGKRIPNEDTLFSLVNLPNYTRPIIAQHQGLIQEAVVDLEIPQTAEALGGVIQSACPLHTCYLALLYMHVQTLIVNQQHRTAGDLCLRISTNPLQEYDDLFYPTAVYALYSSDASLDWPSLLKHAPESSRSTLTLSFRIEFSFLLANLACRKKSLDIARSLLLESLAGMTFLPSDVDSEVLKTFEELLGVNAPECEPVVLSELLSLRGRTYLWLSYCLYSLLCSINTMVPLNHLIEYFQKQPSSEKDRTAFDRLLLHMIIVLANSLPTSTLTANYTSCLNPLLFDPPLTLDRHVIPSWFLEVLQRINWAQLPARGVRQDLCVRLVETYGAHLIPSFCRTLFAMRDHFLAQSLCAIGRIEKPRREDFWVIYAALLLSESSKLVTPSTSRQRIVKLQELFSDAIAAVPSSVDLWQYYALTIKASGTSTALILKCAGEFGMLDAVSEIVREDNPNNSSANSTPRRAPLPSLSTPHSTPRSGNKRKKSSKKKRRYFRRAAKRLNTSGS